MRPKNRTGGFRMVPDVGCCTDEMAHAMSRLDGWDHDRDMPTLQRWKDYWDAAVMAAPTVSKDAEQLGKGEYVRADEAKKVIADLRRNLRHWREECGKLRSKPITADHREMSDKSEADVFRPWDFRDLHDSLVAAINDDKRFKALLSNNYNVILAALKICGGAK